MSEIMPRPTEMLRQLELAGLRDRIAELEEALRYYAKPRTYGSGKHAIFVDDSGVAREAMGDGCEWTERIAHETWIGAGSHKAVQHEAALLRALSQLVNAYDHPPDGTAHDRLRAAIVQARELLNHSPVTGVDGAPA